MAKIDPTSLFTELRGTVGGLTFSKNRSGFFVKRKYAGLPTRRPAPQALRSAFREATIFWQEYKNELVENPEKGEIPVSEWWSDFSDEPGNEKLDVFGGTYKPTGYNWFLTYAVLEYLDGQPPLLLPPTDPTPPLWPDFTVAFFHTGAGVDSYFSSTTNFASQGTRPWISLRVQYHEGAQPVVPPFFFTESLSYPTAGVQMSIQEHTERVFGYIPAGTRCYFQVRFRAPSGRISGPSLFSLLSGESYTHITV